MAYSYILDTQLLSKRVETMSSEQQLQAILEQMHANAATNSNNNTSTTTEEEKANPEVFATVHLWDKFSQFRNSHIVKRR